MRARARHFPTVAEWGFARLDQFWKGIVDQVALIAISVILSAMGARRARTRAMPAPCASHAPGSDFRPDFAQIFFREVKSRLI